MSTTFMPPVPDFDFQELGLGEVGGSAYVQLQKRLAEIADLASREDLARRGSHVNFIPAFTEYATALLECYATFLVAEKDPDVSSNLHTFASWLVAAVIAPHPLTARPEEDGLPVPSGEPSSGALNREDHYHDERHRCSQDGLDWPKDELYEPLLYSDLHPEYLWEESLARVLNLTSVKNKLPERYMSQFVYIFRSVERWEELNIEICTRLAPRVHELIAEHGSSRTGSKDATAKPQMDRSASFPKLNNFTELRIRVISDEDLQAWWEPDGSAGWNFKVLGFEDERGSNNPNKLWHLLQLFALKGELERPLGDDGALEKSVSRLRIHLRKLFQTKDDPLPFDRAARSYSPTFRISSSKPDSL